MDDDGIFKLVKTMSRLGEELVSMKTKLLELTKDDLMKISSEFNFTFENTDGSSDNDRSDWVCISDCYGFSLKKSGKGNHNFCKHLLFQVGLCGVYAKLYQNESSLLNVCFFEESSTVLTSDLLQDYKYQVDLTDNWLWEFKNNSVLSENHWQNTSWAFSVKLSEINSIETLKALVVRPAMALISGKPVDEKVVNHSAIIKYLSIDDNYRCEKI
jgi:hypothetical protein